MMLKQAQILLNKRINREMKINRPTIENGIVSLQYQTARPPMSTPIISAIPKASPPTKGAPPKPAQNPNQTAPVKPKKAGCNRCRRGR